MRVLARGATRTGAEVIPSLHAVAQFVERARRLGDDDRAAIARARAKVDEEFHEQALRAAAEALVGRGEMYAQARVQVAHVHIPERLSDKPQGDEAERWIAIARLVQLVIDEMLLGLVVSDVLHPKHLRELSRAWTVADLHDATASGAEPKA